MSNSSARLTRAPVHQLAMRSEDAARQGERDAVFDALFDRFDSLMTGQLRMEQLLEKLVRGTAPDEPCPPRDSNPIPAKGHEGEEEEQEDEEDMEHFPRLKSHTATDMNRVEKTDSGSEREANCRLARLYSTREERRECLPVWFQTLKMREELKGSEQQLREEFLRSQSSQCHRHSKVELAFGSSSDQRSAAGLRRNCLLTPSSTVRLSLDVFSMFVLAYDMISVPFLVAFDSGVDAFERLSYFSIAYWTCDIILNFRTGFYASGELEMRADKIARRYLTGSFIIDFCLVSVDVLDIIIARLQVTSFSQTNSIKLIRIFKVSRLMRLTGVFRLRRILPLIEQVMAHHATGLMRMLFFLVELVGFIAVFLWLNHLLACLWFFQAHSIGEHSDTGFSWLDQMTGDREYGSYGNWYLYTTALHWAITQMTPGSMQIFPQNSAERVFNILCLVAGLVIFSTIISAISARVTNFRIQMQSFRTKMDQLTGFLERVCASGELRVAVCQQVDMRLHETRPVGVKDLNVLNLLSLSLRLSLQLELCNPHLLEHPYLTFVAEADHMTWKEVCMNCVDFNMLMRKDTLFVHGTQAAAMYFVTMGKLSYSPEPAFRSLSREGMSSEDIAGVEPGKSLSEAALWCRWRHVGTAEVLNTRHCEVLTLNAEKLLKALISDPLVRQVTWAYGLSFFTFLKGCKPPISPPNDLITPFGVDEVIASMPKSATILCGQVAIKVLRQRPETLFSWARTVMVDNTEQLIKEVNDGGSTLLATKRQGVVRCVPLLLIRITRTDRKILVRLRLIKKADGSPEATCKLPGGRQEAGEHPEDCLDRLLQDKLRPLRGMHIEGIEKQSQIEHSRKFGVPTRYVRTVISADWKDTVDAELNLFLLEEAKRRKPQVSVEARLTRRGNFNQEACDSLALSSPEDYVPADVYSFPGGDIYAWLTQEEYSHFDSVRGQKCLFHWLSFLGMDGAGISSHRLCETPIIS